MGQPRTLLEKHAIDRLARLPWKSRVKQAHGGKDATAGVRHARQEGASSETHGGKRRRQNRTERSNYSREALSDAGFPDPTLRALAY